MEMEKIILEFDLYSHKQYVENAIVIKKRLYELLQENKNGNIYKAAKELDTNPLTTVYIIYGRTGSVKKTRASGLSLSWRESLLYVSDEIFERFISWN